MLQLLSQPLQFLKFAKASQKLTDSLFKLSMSTSWFLSHLLNSWTADLCYIICTMSHSISCNRTQQVNILSLTWSIVASCLILISDPRWPTGRKKGISLHLIYRDLSAVSSPDWIINRKEYYCQRPSERDKIILNFWSN